MANEKRLIDANALLERMEKRLSDLTTEYGQYDQYVNGFDEGCIAVDDADTVDAVEVVRCKDCKHWKDEVSGCTDHVKCCEIGFYMVGENGYCVYGEKEA